MILKVQTFEDEAFTPLLDLGNDDFIIGDTVDDWLVLNSNGDIVAVFCKVATLSIVLIPDVFETKT